ncbi:helix-turn-helix transcriptional regulator [Luteibacter aegosomatis]|uniref:helix-turn-helix transcriptional regulator n=1 Tax=Luteibacter aegosomatis TaxID=2911537 RepID=UPI001FF8FCCA|nr:helix-turn-helix transcriptional regulator [Luteibacter aegosomatis]UPG84523.1 helix-turn-helix transcriptional regulator [Luteibacter aegosomatis]
MRQRWKEQAGVRDGLIADLYESVFSPADVPGVIARINRYLDCDGVHMVGWDESKNEVLMSLVTGNHIQGAEAAYLSHYQFIDPRRKMGLKSPTGIVVACHDELDDRYVSGSEFYQDFLIPHGPRYVAGGNIFRDQGRNVHIAFNHLVGRNRFEGAKRDALGGMMFHLARWMPMMVRADWLREAAAGSQASIDMLDRGLAFLDDMGRVLHANPAAVRLLGDQLGRVNLGLSGPMDGSTVDVHIRTVMLTRRPHTLTIHRGRQRLALTLSPLPRTPGNGAHGLGKLVGSLGGGEGLHHRASVVLTVCAPAGTSREALAGLAKQWGLTPAEEALLRALAAGTSPAQHAEGRGVKISTVRSQVRALLEKSACENLRALLSTIARISHA